MVRTSRPPGAVSCAPNTCSMRARMRLFVRFAACAACGRGEGIGGNQRMWPSLLGMVQVAKPATIRLTSGFPRPGESR